MTSCVQIYNEILGSIHNLEDREKLEKVFLFLYENGAFNTEEVSLNTGVSTVDTVYFINWLHREGAIYWNCNYQGWMVVNGAPQYQY